MLFISRTTNADDIRNFRVRFNEGLRVEYQANFDGKVGQALAKIKPRWRGAIWHCLR
jgi:hypothetical protein